MSGYRDLRLQRCQESCRETEMSGYRDVRRVVGKQRCQDTEISDYRDVRRVVGKQRCQDTEMSDHGASPVLLQHTIKIVYIYEGNNIGKTWPWLPLHIPGRCWSWTGVRDTPILCRISVSPSRCAALHRTAERLPPLWPDWGL